MTVRLTAMLAVVALVLAACGSSSDSADDVPEDQQLQPVPTPEGWAEADLGPVTIATPPEWERQPATEPADGLIATTWRAAEVDGVAPAGVEVRVIEEPQQDAEKAALALATSAMAMMQAGKSEPKQISWPDATSAWFLTYRPKVRIDQEDPTRTKAFTAALLVLDLSDGTQIQVNALSDTDEDLPVQVLATVVSQVEVDE